MKISGTGPLAKACEVCVFDGRGELEKSFMNKEKNAQQIVYELLKEHDIEMSVYRWYKHMKEHVYPAILPAAVDNMPELIGNVKTMVDDVAGIIDRLKTKSEKLSDKVDADSDPNLIRTYVAMEVALGQAIERLGRVTGDLKGVTNVKQQNVKYEFNNFAGQLLQDLCPVCKAKAAETIEPLIKKIN